MTPQRRQKILLALLVAGALVAAWVHFWPLIAGDGYGDGPGGRGRPGLAADAGVEVTPLATDALLADARDYRPGRDPFRYGEPPPPPGPTPEELEAMRAAEAERRAAEEEMEKRMEEEQAVAALAEPPRPQPPPFELTYLGSFGPEGRRIAVFTDGDGEIFNALVGDVIAEQFVLDDIGYESVAIKYLAFPEEPPQRVAIGS